MGPAYSIVLLLGAGVGSYLAASVNFSIVAARLLGKGDLRSIGSGNAGATNLSRAAGKPAAAIVLAADLGRASGIILAARALGLGDLASALALPFLLGNLFPVFHGFKGGKGVAASVGLVLAISPLAMLCGGGVFLAVLAISRRVSPGSIAMALGYPAWIWLFGGSATEIAVCGTIALVVAATHRGNIARMIRGEEPRLFGETPKATGGGA